MDRDAALTLLHDRREAHLAAFSALDEAFLTTLADAATRMAVAIGAGRTIYACGNGGSAADAQHFTAELSGRYLKERRSLAAVALSTNTSAMTAIANDYGYEQVFSRQLEGVAKRGDVLLAISTSGKSPNMLRTAEVARAAGVTVVGLTGKSGGPLRQKCDVVLAVPADHTPVIQELHLFVIHSLCELIDGMV